MVEVLHNSWFELSEKYFKESSEVAFLWKKIQENYTSKNRYYHNLIHIHSMLEKASENRNHIKKYDELLFAIWFHDIFYKASSKKNEEKSANFAVSVLQKAVEEKLNLTTIRQLIISTKSHKIILNENNDNAFLLDFDLSILGSDWNVYQTYIENIRKEYKIYPDFLYKPARKKVLQHFLERDTLYFTNKYQNLFEESARQNISRELKQLS